METLLWIFNVAGILLLILWVWRLIPRIRSIREAQANNRKARALIETGDIYRDRGALQEADECYKEASRLALESLALLNGHESTER